MSNELTLTPRFGTHNREWLIVISELSKRTIDDNVANMVDLHIRQNKDMYEDMLQNEAQRLGLTRDELFSQLVNGATLWSLIAKNAIDIG